MPAAACSPRSQQKIPALLIALYHFCYCSSMRHLVFYYILYNIYLFVFLLLLFDIVVLGSSIFLFSSQKNEQPELKHVETVKKNLTLDSVRSQKYQSAHGPCWDPFAFCWSNAHRKRVGQTQALLCTKRSCDWLTLGAKRSTSLPTFHFLEPGPKGAVT